MTIHPKAIEMLTDDINRCQEKINEFAEQLKAHPLYSLEWAARTAEVAVELEIFTVLKMWAETRPDEVTYDEFAAWLRDQLSNSVSNLSSTSAFSNATNLTKVQRINSMLGAFGGLRGYFKKDA